MVKSRLFEVFDSLPPSDIKVLKKFVYSPFFNQRDHVLSLFNFLVVCKYEKKVEPDREAAFKFVFPKRPFDDHKLRLSMSLLVKVIEKFLIWKEISDDEPAMNLHLARGYKKLGLQRHFSKSIQTFDAQVMNSADRNATFFQNKYLLYSEQYQFNSEHNRMEGLYLEEIQENFDTAFLASKMKQACLLLSHQAIYKKQYNEGLLPEVIQHIESNDYLTIPAISIYYFYYKSLTEEENYQHFNTFKELMFQHQRLFPKMEIRDLFLLAANYCIQQLNKGKKSFAKEGLEIYKEGLTRGILLSNNTLSHFTYRNIVAKAIVTKNYDWAVTFLHEYQPKLEPQHRANSFSFNLAWLEYERKNYSEALSLINQTNFTDLLLNLSAKTIALKIYYEMEAFDLLYSHLDAMLSFLHRKKIIAYHKKNYLNTIRFTKRILDLPPGDKAKQKKLRELIETTNGVAEKKWLLDQLS